MLKKLLGVINPKELYTPDQIKPTLILLFAAILPTIHVYFGSIQFTQQTFPAMSSFQSSSYMFLGMFIFMGIIPFLIIRFIFKDSLKDYGLKLGKWREGLLLTLFLIIIIAGAMLYPSSQTPDFRSVYPFDKSAGESVLNFLRFELIRGLFFYTAWEFFFRGFMLFGLRKYVGDWLSICIQTVPSCLWHIGLPTGEILASIAAGFLFGIMAIRTNSIVWVFILHYLIGIFLDLFVVIM